MARSAPSGLRVESWIETVGVAPGPLYKGISGKSNAIGGMGMRNSNSLSILAALAAMAPAPAPAPGGRKRMPEPPNRPLADECIREAQAKRERKAAKLRMLAERTKPC